MASPSTRRDLKGTGCRFQITSDGFAPYRHSIPDTFGNRVDFAMNAAR